MGKDLASGKPVPVGDKEVIVRPLTLRQLRKFLPIVKKLDNVSEGELTDEDIDNMVEAASIALEKADPELAGDRELLQDSINIVSFNILLGAAMGNEDNPEE